MRRFLILASALLAFGAAEADVQIRIQSLHDVSTISSNGKRVRIDGGKMLGYGIVDPTAGEMLMVDPARAQVMRSSFGSGPPSDAAGDPVVRLSERGKGPRIAGYATREFSFSADGKACGAIFASRELLENRQVRTMFESMRTMQARSRGMMGGFGGTMDACQRAGLGLTEALESAGAPMRIVDASGQLQSEVLEVDTDARPGSDFYEVPAGMAVVDFDEQMKAMQQQSQTMMQNLPDMNEMLQQMQQGGGQMSEEMQQQMQQQMQQMQQMLEQLQQQ